jgi:hypothetical protein
MSQMRALPWVLFWVRGVFPIHCHMADHEDNGMMATIRVV